MPNPFFMVFVLFAIMLVLKPDSTVTEIGGGTAADREQIANLSRAWLESWQKGDFDRLAPIMHDDVVAIISSQPSLRGDEPIREHLASRTDRALLEFVDEPEEMRVEGDWAYVRGRITVTFDAGANEAPEMLKRRYFVLSEKVDDEWKVLRSIHNLAPESTG